MSTGPADREALHAALDADPSEQRLRLVLADWYEDHDEAASAEALRWLARHDKFPEWGYWGTPWAWHSPLSARTEWGYAAEGKRPPRASAVLPDEVYRELRGHHWRHSQEPPYWKPYTSRREAEEALCQAFGRARARGWRPPG
jgi:uncharacterized protein (TIGR02996 family)